MENFPQYQIEKDGLLPDLASAPSVLKQSWAISKDAWKLTWGTILYASQLRHWIIVH